jgi:hypothetical protein
MPHTRTFLFAAAVLGAAVLGSVTWSERASAQQAVGVDPGRDCQTVRTCNFTRSGRVRGCLSSYTCRICRLVTARCTLAGRSRCQEVVCTWGG